jgi:hypothetical protein
MMSLHYICNMKINLSFGLITVDFQRSYCTLYYTLPTQLKKVSDSETFGRCAREYLHYNDAIFISCAHIKIQKAQMS